MGTKENPGRFDCYANALRDEPMFVLLARDPMFETLVRAWVARRQADILCGERPTSDHLHVSEALDAAFAGARWRRENMGKWREPRPAEGREERIERLWRLIGGLQSELVREALAEGR